MKSRERERQRVDAMLRYARKRLNQRRRKPIAKHATETAK